MSDTGYTGLGSRKSHRKSPLGCLNCKRRRIKCDESRPQCNNCTRHSVPCSYPTASKTPTSSHGPLPGTCSPHHKEHKQDSPPSAMEEGIGAEWGPISLELMHNYTTATCFSLSDNPMLQTFMQINVPKMGFEHKHILHLILSLSALHLARFKPDQNQLYLQHADRHYQASLRIAAALLQNPLPKSDPSVYLFASMCNAFVLAKGPKEDDFLLFSDDGPAEWMSLLRGAKALFNFNDEPIHSGELAPMIQSGIRAASQGPVTLPPSEMDMLACLRDLVDAASSSSEEVDVLNTSVDNLWTLFSSRYDGSGRKIQAQFQDVGVWLYRCSDEFTALLQRHHPAALIIFAHACIIINDLSSNWAMSGWVPHLLSGIYKNLPPDYHPAIQRPLQEIGWIPPCT